MSDLTAHYSEMLVRMRRAFDEDFESVRSFEVEETESFLVVRVGDERIALRLAQLAGIEVSPKVMPVPVDLPALVGLASVAGVLMPVYRLGVLLGRSTPAEARQWIAICRGTSPAGLAIDELVGQVEAPSSARHPAGSAARKHVTQLLQTEDGFQPIIDVPSVLLELESLSSGRRAAGASNQRED